MNTVMTTFFVSLLFTFFVEQFIYRVLDREDRFDIMLVISFCFALLNVGATFVLWDPMFLFPFFIWIGNTLAYLQFSHCPYGLGEKSMNKGVIYFLISLGLTIVFALIV